jgi:hypothetical protein
VGTTLFLTLLDLGSTGRLLLPSRVSTTRLQPQSTNSSWIPLGRNWMSTVSVVLVQGVSSILRKWGIVRTIRFIDQRSLTDELKGVSLKVNSDGEEYNGKLQLKKTTSGNVRKYQPVVQYTLPGGNPVDLIEGQVVRIVGEQVQIDLRTTGPVKSLRGHVKGTYLTKVNWQL